MWWLCTLWASLVQLKYDCCSFLTYWIQVIGAAVYIVSSLFRLHCLNRANTGWCHPFNIPGDCWASAWQFSGIVREKAGITYERFGAAAPPGDGCVMPHKVLWGLGFCCVLTYKCVGTAAKHRWHGEDPGPFTASGSPVRTQSAMCGLLSWCIIWISSPPTPSGAHPQFGCQLTYSIAFFPLHIQSSIHRPRIHFAIVNFPKVFMLPSCRRWFPPDVPDSSRRPKAG